MPSRTIDVGPPDGSQPPFLAISNTKNSSSELWSALSHRWGSSNPLTLTSKNLKKLTSGIDMQRLPQTFKDAISVTRKLGIRHLWVDSLCIIQDSRDDWAYESHRMSDVYRGALVNICPSAALDCDDSFLNKKRALWSPDVEISLENTRHGSGTIFLGSTQGSWLESTTTDPSAANQGERLHDRAWVL